jgi:hypothetical protein
MQSLNGVGGDIDGMQAPPLDLGIDVQNAPASAGTTTAPNSTNPNSGGTSGVLLPPIPDSDVAPPKDLDVPPTDNLGNLNIDSKNK